MKIKPGVSLAGLQPQALLALTIASQVYDSFGLTAVLTSCWRHNAMLHSEGKAFDLRAPRRCGAPYRPVPPGIDQIVTDTVREALGGPKPGGQFDVLFEQFPADPNNDHIHIEWDPK